MSLSLDFLNNVSSFLIAALAILYSISIHEFGHAFVAYLNGDSTAKNLGRMTINPLDHIDIFGMITMFLVHFGWAKPVPVNPNNYKNEKIGNITVSLAGISFNILSAVIFANIYKYFDNDLSRNIMQTLIIYNVGFAAFNILPLPPLDGWSFISTFLPRETVYKTYQYSNYMFILFIVLMMTNLLTIILNPVYTFFYDIVLTFI